MENRRFIKPRLISVPSWVMPGTYAENLRFIAGHPEISGVELLFFIYDDEIRSQFREELEEVESFSQRFVFTAHLPETLKDEHEELVETLLPLVKHFIVHPGKADAVETQARLINRWVEKYGSSDSPRFLVENTNPGLLEKTIPLLDPWVGLCMDTGHLLIEDRNPALYFSQHRDRIAEIHLHGLDREKAAADGRLPDHRPIKPDASWFRELFPVIENFDGIVNLEVFSWEEAAQSIAAIKQINEPETGENYARH
jgi:sugar phosphate isomerase/epimerase